MNEQLEKYEKIAAENHEGAEEHYQEGDYEQAESRIKIAIEAYLPLCESDEEHYFNLVDCYCLQARICLLGKEDNDAAVAFLDMAVATLEKIQEIHHKKTQVNSLQYKLDCGDWYHNLAMLFSMAEQLEKAKDCYICGSVQVETYVLTWCHNEYDEETLALNLNCHIGIADILNRQNNYTEALHFCNLTMELFDENPDVEAEDYQLIAIDLYLAYGEAHEGLGNYQIAEKYYLEALNDAKELFTEDCEGGSAPKLQLAGIALRSLYKSGKIEGDSDAIAKLVNELLGE